MYVYTHQGRANGQFTVATNREYYYLEGAKEKENETDEIGGSGAKPAEQTAFSSANVCIITLN